MNTLTKNRILQEGDEYFEPKGGRGWMPVPENDYGLQIMFTKYGEVRRPSEKPFPAPNGSSNESQPVPTHAKAQTTEGAKGGDRTHSAAGNPISDAGKAQKERETSMDKFSEEQIAAYSPPRRPDCKPISPDSDSDSRPQGQKSVAAKAEKEKTPAPTPSGAGESPNVKAKLVPMTPEQLTIQQQETDREIIARIPLPCNRKVTNEEQAALDREIARQPKLKPISTRITFPKPDPAASVLEISEQQPIWTGRNGTFTGYGLEAMRVNDNVMLSPIGKRGIGNCCIQIPLGSLDALMDFLKQQTPKI